jgi:hypothetical protein
VKYGCHCLDVTCACLSGYGRRYRTVSGSAHHIDWSQRGRISRNDHLASMPDRLLCFSSPTSSLSSDAKALARKV